MTVLAIPCLAQVFLINGWCYGCMRVFDVIRRWAPTWSLQHLLHLRMQPQTNLRCLHQVGQRNEEAFHQLFGLCGIIAYQVEKIKAFQVWETRISDDGLSGRELSFLSHRHVFWREVCQDIVFIWHRSIFNWKTDLFGMACRNISKDACWNSEIVFSGACLLTNCA